MKVQIKEKKMVYAATSNQKPAIYTAWVFLLLASSIPLVVTQELFHQPVAENMKYTMSAAVTFIGLVLTFAWSAIRTLRPFFIVFITFTCAQWLVYTRVDKLPFYHEWLNHPSFNVSMLAEQTLHLIVTLIMIGVLFVLKKKREIFFLVKGNTDALISPVNWLGIKEGERWNKTGWVLAFFISLGTLTFLVLAGRPPLDIVIKALPFLPAILLAAATNAFHEEVSYKASFLSVLEQPVGRVHALWLMAAYFGLAHYYGVPYGVIGVLMAGFLGWLLGKSMLETRGLWWAWFIHFLQDVLIFSFLAIGSIIPGGG